MEVKTGVIVAGVLYLIINIVLIYFQKRIEDRYKALREESIELKEETLALLLDNQHVLDKIRQARKPQALISYINKENEMKWIYERRDKIKVLDFDTFMEWCDFHDDNYLVDSIPYFEAAQLTEKAEIIKGYLQNKKAK